MAQIRILSHAGGAWAVAALLAVGVPVGASDDIDSLYTGAPPALLGSDPDDASALVSDEGLEVIRERYPNRNIKIERHVVQDSSGNYTNHGLWSMWSPEGRLLGRGEYDQGQRHGVWTRWFEAGEGEMFSGDIFSQFEPPFASQVRFQHGVIDGAWTVRDKQGREVANWEFRSGRRHGNSVWWYPSGEKWRQVSYRNGEVHGEVFEWLPTGEVALHERYINGRRYAAKTEYHSPGVKKYTVDYLYARPLVESTDDWWNGITRVKVLGKEGRDERHGTFTAWDPNGQKILEGRYEYDRPVGRFTWWHPNGQKSIEGAYTDGNQDGQWVWWHPNGKKQIEGYYTDGDQTGEWSWFDAGGKLTASTNYDAQDTQLAEDDLPEELKGLPIVEFIVEERTPNSALTIGLTPGPPASVGMSIGVTPGPPSTAQPAATTGTPTSAWQALPFKLSAPTRK